MALSQRRHQAQKDNMLGFQFVATQLARAFTGDMDIDFMPYSAPQKVFSLDQAEGWFKSMAEAGKTKTAKEPELGD